MKVHPGKYLLLQLLKDKIINQNKIVPVILEFAPDKKLPAITMSSNGGTGILETYVYKKLEKLPPNHPYYNPKHPDELYTLSNINVNTQQQRLILHIWANTNEERDLINEQILKTLENSKKTKIKLFNELNIPTIGFQIGTASDIDQQDLVPPLYHSTIPIQYTINKIYTEPMTPFCEYHKKQI
jgi:hypothetical protein